MRDEVLATGQADVCGLFRAWAVPALYTRPQPIPMGIVLTGEHRPIERLHGHRFTNCAEDGPDAVRARAAGPARRIVAGAPLSVRAATASLHATMDAGCRTGPEEGKGLQEVVCASQDATEGPHALAEKRAPRWTGRWELP